MSWARTLPGGLLAVALVFALNATTQALVFVDMDFNQGDVGPGGVVQNQAAGSGITGQLFGGAQVFDGRLQIDHMKGSLMGLNFVDVFGTTPFGGGAPFSIAFDIKTASSGLIFDAENGTNLNRVPNGPPDNERGAWSFRVNNRLNRDNWWISGAGGGPSLVDNVEHHVLIEYVPDVINDTSTLTYTIDGEVINVNMANALPSQITHPQDLTIVWFGGSLNTAVDGWGDRFDYLDGWLDNVVMIGDAPPPIPGHFFSNGPLVFDTDANTITLNGVDANFLIFKPYHDPDPPPQILGPGTYVGSGTTTYTFGPLADGEWLTFHTSITSVTKVGTNDISFVVPGDMLVGADMGNLGPISLTVDSLQMNGGSVLDASGGAIVADTVDVRGGGSLTLSSGNITDLLVGGTLSLGGATSVNQLSLNGGTVNDGGGGSLTSTNVSTTSGEMAFELGGGSVNVPLTGPGGVHVTGEVTLGAANTYSGPTRISTGGSLQTTNPTGIDPSSSGLELDGGSIVVNSATVEPQLGTDVEFLISDDRNTRAGGGWAAAGQDAVLTINNGATLKYASTPGWLGAGAGGGNDGFGRSVLGLNNSGLATHTIELTNDLDLNSVAGNNNTRAFGVASGKTAIFSGDLLDTGSSANGDVGDRAIFAVGGGGTLELTGDGSSGGFTGTFAGGGVLFTSDDYFAPSVNWNFDGTRPIPGSANDFTTDGVTDLGGTTQHASTVNLGGTGGINNGTLHASGTIHVETGVTVGVNLIGASTLQISDGTVNLNGSNSAVGGIIIGGFDVDDPGDADGTFIRLGHNNALGPAGSTATISPAASDGRNPGDEREIGLTVADGSTGVDIQANISMGDEVLTLEATGGGVLTISGVISGNTIDVVDANTLLPIATVEVPGGEGGKVVLNGNNTYTGVTSIIQNGILEVNGSSASPIHDIRDDGTLQGSGTVNSVIVGETGTFRPGISATGNMTASSVVWGGGGTFSVIALERRTAGLGTVGGEPAGHYTVQFTTASDGTPGTVASAGEHVGFGNFVVSASTSSSILGATLFQAVSGDTNGDLVIDNFDILDILAVNSFGNGPGFDWTEGDFTGDTQVKLEDIQLIQATNLFEAGVYAANPTGTGMPGDGIADLIIHPDGTATLDPDGLSLNGFILKSLGGNFTGMAMLPNALFTTNDQGEAGVGFLLVDIISPVDLGQLYDPLAMPQINTDLDFTYTVANTQGLFDGNCINCTPEPSTFVLLVLGVAGLWMIRRRG